AAEARRPIHPHDGRGAPRGSRPRRHRDGDDPRRFRRPRTEGARDRRIGRRVAMTKLALALLTACTGTHGASCEPAVAERHSPNAVREIRRWIGIAPNTLRSWIVAARFGPYLRAAA